MTPTAAPLTSPCVRICVLDSAGDCCTGCGRTLGEIAAWSGLADEARLAIMAELGERLRPRSIGGG